MYITPANNIEPANGDSECTTGNQVCTGTNGVLTAIPIDIAKNNIHCKSIDKTNKLVA